MKSKKKIIGLATACALLGSNFADAQAILTFSQDGADVKASWSGTLTLASFPAFFDQSYGASGSVGSSYVVGSVAGTGTRAAVLGSPTTSTLATAVGLYDGLVFGFGDNRLYLDSVFRGLSEFTPVGTFTFSNSTLDGLGAASFSNTLAWATSDGFASSKIYYNTIPEPHGWMWSFIATILANVIRRR